MLSCLEWDLVKVKGFYYIEHKPTGQVFTGTSTDAEKDMQVVLDSLTTASSRCKRLTKLCKLDNALKSKVVEAPSIKEAKVLEKAFRAAKDNYILIN